MKKFFALALSLALALTAFAGCSSTSASTSTPSAASGSTAGSTELNLYTWEGMFPQEVLDAFTAETGIKVNYSSFDTDETMLAKLETAKGGDYDVVIADDYIIETAIAEGLVMELDKSKIANIGNVNPVYQGQFFDPEDAYTVPYGAGVQTIEMNFLPDVYVTCKSCGGHRYNRETLEVKYKGKNIDDVLNMTVNMAVEFFENIPSIYQKLRAIQEVGLGYLTLGQPCTTLSGGESQRIKLAAELSKRDTGSTLYILDEPTTGLHFEDIRQLIDVLNKLVDRGNTVVVIEHNLDVVKVADWIIDIGPEGGAAGGRVLAAGTPHEVAAVEQSYTGRFLRQMGL